MQQYVQYWWASGKVTYSAYSIFTLNTQKTLPCYKMKLIILFNDTLMHAKLFFFYQYFILSIENIALVLKFPNLYLSGLIGQVIKTTDRSGKTKYPFKFPDVTFIALSLKHIKIVRTLLSLYLYLYTLQT
jgi:hypothetical protein